MAYDIVPCHTAAACLLYMYSHKLFQSSCAELKGPGKNHEWSAMLCSPSRIHGRLSYAAEMLSASSVRWENCGQVT